MRMAPYNRRIARRDACREIELSRLVMTRRAGPSARTADAHPPIPRQTGSRSEFVSTH